MQRSLAYCRSAAAGLSVLLAGAASAVAAPAVDPGKLSLQEYARLPVCTLSADGKHLAVEPCRTAPAKNPMPRRPVPLMAPRQQALPAPPAGPALSVSLSPVPPSAVLPSQAMAPVRAAPPLPHLSAPPGLPTPALNCDPGGCYDLNGVRHNNAAGNSTITPSGKLCIRNGAWLQCQ